jgi:2,3-dihydroxyphenylpropionate 1,2-dioxygenase
MLELVCTSHSPLLLSVTPTERDQGRRFYDAIEKVHQFIVSYDPELIVLFAPDHFNGFFHDLMPQYCVGFNAVGTHDWGIETGTLNVPVDVARDLAHALLADGLDVATSYRMKVDHGFTIALSLLTKRLDAYPTIPIFINCASTPRASCKRARQLGEAVGRYLETLPKRALVVGSGGLSHDPPHASFEQASPEAQKSLVREAPWPIEFERHRQERVKSAARELVEGKTPILPPSKEWDARILDVLIHQKLDEVDLFSDEWITKAGGRGGHEIRSWISAFASLGVQGRYQAEVIYYDIVTDWVTGMAVVHAHGDAASGRNGASLAATAAA